MFADVSRRVFGERGVVVLVRRLGFRDFGAFGFAWLLVSVNFGFVVLVQRLGFC